MSFIPASSSLIAPLDLDYFRNSGMSDIEKFNSICGLQHRNETLFYKVIIENIKEMAPIVYTPTGLPHPPVLLIHLNSFSLSLLSGPCLSTIQRQFPTTKRDVLQY